jgi:hypothetical protein
MASKLTTRHSGDLVVLAIDSVTYSEPTEYSADFQSAVSPASSRQTVRISQQVQLPQRLRIGNPRYSRLGSQCVSRQGELKRGIANLSGSKAAQVARVTDGRAGLAFRLGGRERSTTDQTDSPKWWGGTFGVLCAHWPEFVSRWCARPARARGVGSRKPGQWSAPNAALGG